MITLDRDKIWITTEDGPVEVPKGVNDINAFRSWIKSDDRPEYGRYWWLEGAVWVDLSMEEIFTHVGVKTEFTIVVGGISRSEKRGRYFTDGILLTNFAADFSGIPDGLFLSYDTLNSDRIRFQEGNRGGYTELQGSPDMVLEIVSRSSVYKDNQVLKKVYWEAGIREYWLVDARSEPIEFTIYRYTSRGYIAARKTNGWVSSKVFGKSFRLSLDTTVRNKPQFTLEVR